MLFKQATLEAVAEGRVTLAFRRWRRPTVRAGSTLLTAVGVLSIDSVDPIELEEIKEKDARAAGHADLHALRSMLTKRSQGIIHRIAFHLVGPDPRVSLREQLPDGADELAQLRSRLGRWDTASPSGPWTRPVLELLGRHPGVRAANLAGTVGMDKQRFKANVRKLKSLGLTESLEVGYRLSRRGEAVLRDLTC